MTVAPFHRILVPVEFSEGSAAALARALTLPLASRARLDLLHVLPPRIAAKVRVQVAATARDELAQAVARARAATAAEVTSELRRGTAYVEIIRRARDIDAELVVVGRHGKRPVRDLFVGSTASRLVRMGDTPILVVREPPAGGYRRVMVAIDLGDTSRRTLELAVRTAGAHAAVHVVHAFHVPFEGFLASTQRAREAVRREYGERALAQLARLVAPFARRVTCTTAVRAGDPRAVLLNEAARSRAELVVLGTHGRAGLAHALIGSIAEGVIADASCDVLVARPVRFSFALP